MLEASPGAEAGGVGGQERERPLLVVPVLREMEADPPHLPPAWRPRAQQGGHAARGGGGVLHPRVELLPQTPQEVRREILASLHRRSVQDPGGEERVARRLDRHLSGVLGQVAEPGQVVFRKLLPVAQAGDLLRRQLLRRQGEERAAPVAPKGVQARDRERPRARPLRDPAPSADDRPASVARPWMPDCARQGEWSTSEQVRPP